MRKTSQWKRRAGGAKRAMDQIAMTPMIDVVFQMLIYFVLTFQIADRLSEMPVWRPEHGPGAGISPPTVTVYHEFYTFNGTRMDFSQLERSLKTLADLQPDDPMVVVATGSSRHGELVRVLNAMSGAGLRNISLLSTE